MDPELVDAAARFPALSYARADIEATRALFNGLLAAVPPPDLTGLEVETVIVDGRPDVGLRIIRRPGAAGPQPAVLDIHGGAFVLGTAQMDDRVNSAIARETGGVVISVDYRLAPEHPYPAPLDDCYAALEWIAANADRLGVDTARIAVLGSSAGGCLAAAMALRARDEGGPALAMQALLAPALDDRCDSHSMRTVGRDSVNWRRSDAADAWEQYLGGAGATPYAAPARAPELAGLPRTYLTVGELDPLRDEGIAYAQRLLAAGVPTELHCWPQVFHGFSLVPGAAVARRASRELIDAIRAGLGIVAAGEPPTR